VSEASAATVVTIDGPAGSGKSSVAQRLAKRLGWQVLDTGAMYRASALLALRRGIDPAEGERVAEALEDAEIGFDWSSDPPRIMLDGEAVDEAIRTAETTEAAAQVAGSPAVRAMLVDAQRRIAAGHPKLISEGRDQGSVVFPDAVVRFFLDAPVEERAHRRALQLAAAGVAADESAIRSAIRERDELDRTRLVGPLVKPSGAIVVDTTSLSLEQVVDRLEAAVREELVAVGRGV
jgi:cytidylate kinase